MSMRVLVVPHRPEWADAFAFEAERIAAALPGVVVATHHVGSTAIPGIVAKPILDLVVAVADLGAVDRSAAAMAGLGYEAMGEFGIPTRRYFRKDNDAGVRTHHVHMFPRGSAQITRHLAFRDYLTAYPEWAGRYSDLKEDLARRYPGDMERYIAGKDGLIREIDVLAAEWRKGLE